MTIHSEVSGPLFYHMLKVLNLTFRFLFEIIFSLLLKWPFPQHRARLPPPVHQVNYPQRAESSSFKGLAVVYKMFYGFLSRVAVPTEAVLCYHPFTQDDPNCTVTCDDFCGWLHESSFVMLQTLISPFYIDFGQKGSCYDVVI